MDNKSTEWMKILRHLIALNKNIPEGEVRTRGLHNIVKRMFTRDFIREYYLKTPEKFHKESGVFVADRLAQDLLEKFPPGAPKNGLLLSERSIRSAIKTLVADEKIPRTLAEKF